MRMTSYDKRIDRPRLAAYAALLALALFQLGAAMHQAEHAVAELGESCVACSHYNDFGPVPAAAKVPVVAPLADPLVPLPIVGMHDADRYPAHARAPPST